MLRLEGHQEALWALRIHKKGPTYLGSVVDIFGLAAYRWSKDEPIFPGRLAYALWGEDTSLLDLVYAAERWWSQGFVEDLHFVRGRPRGTGTWATAQAFESDLRTAVKSLNTKREVVTQEKVAGQLHCDVSTLKRWLKRLGINWRDIKMF